MLVEIPTNMGFSKGKSSLIIHERHTNLKYNIETDLLCREYYVDTVGKNTKKTAEYIQKQINFKIN